MVCPDKGILAEFEFGDSQECSSTCAKGETTLLLSTVPVLLESDGAPGTIAPLAAYYTVTLELFLYVKLSLADGLSRERDCDARCMEIWSRV